VVLKSGEVVKGDLILVSAVTYQGRRTGANLIDCRRCLVCLERLCPLEGGRLTIQDTIPLRVVGRQCPTTAHRGHRVRVFLSIKNWPAADSPGKA
jgi:hypothetical protein